MNPNLPPKKPKTEFAPDTAAQTANLAHTSVNRAEAAFDTAAEKVHEGVQMADATAVAFKSRAADLQMKSLEIMQANMGAAFAYARRAFEIRDPADLIKLNQDFARERFEALSTQTADLNALGMALARETMRPVRESMNKSIDGFAKSIAA